MGGVANQDQTTESGADDAAASKNPHQLILMKPHGRLRCTDRRREVGRDWPEQRCALPVAPTDPSALTRVRLRACAAGHSNIDKASSGVKLATLGASRTSWRTTTEPMARSGSGRDASGSARCEPCHHSRGAWEHRSCVRQLRTRDVRPALAVGARTLGSGPGPYWTMLSSGSAGSRLWSNGRRASAMPCVDERF